ncbi:hypothetical protein LguiB_001755 [Lonicera macranthoides]
MEKRINEIEFDEFEKLLGEIPSATSGNPHPEESLAPIFAKRTLNENHTGLTDRKTSAKEIQNSTVKMVQQEEEEGEEEPNLPDDQSILTSAFSELSFRDGSAVAVMGPTSPLPPMVNYNQNTPSVLLNGQYTAACALKKCHPPNGVDQRVMLVRSPNNPSNTFASNVQELKKQQQIDYCQQPVDDFSGVPLTLSGVQGFQLLPNMPPPVPTVEFPPSSIYMDAQSPLPYIHHPQQLSQQPQITWRQMEHEQYYYRMHQQYLYLQQQQQQLRNQPQFQDNGNAVTRLINRTAQKTHIERCNQDPFWNEAAIPRSINQSSSPTLSSSDYNIVQQRLHQAGKHNFPEKILTRSHGINSLRSVKFGSFGGTEPPLANNINNQNGRVLTNGGYCSLSNPNVGFQFDSLSSKSSSPDMVDLKHSNNSSNNSSLRPMVHRCGSIDEYIGRIYLMAKDQHGCRFLQRKFTEGTKDDVEKIFLEIIVHIVELMTDPFGNYLVQKLLEVCDEDQQMQILHAITRKPGDLVRISCDMHGTRAVQKVIETLKTPEQVSIVVSSLKPSIVTLIKNMNGNHVAQRCLQYLTPQYSETTQPILACHLHESTLILSSTNLIENKAVLALAFLFEAATANCVELATDRHGCCVLQKCLSHSDSELRRRLVCEITSNSLILSQDPFGNYVVQFVFEINVPWATEDILDQLDGNYGDLSMQKYSSNVVEKCLKYAGEERQHCIMQELINNSRLDQIMQDPYGNYVIQAALNLSKGSLHSALVEAIRTHVPVLRTSPYGKKVLSSNSLKK